MKVTMTKDYLPSHPDLMSPEEAGKAMGVTRQTIYNWIRKGILKSIKVGDVRRITKADLNELIEKKKGGD